MSRVRVLNLPRNCTEDQLRQHIIKTAPADAPVLDITDVQFIRREEPATYNKKNAKPTKGKGNTKDAASTSKGLIRMAFVGFKTSAAGHFAVKYFNNSFFQSARLKVELAKGLSEVEPRRKPGSAKDASKKPAKGGEDLKRPREEEAAEGISKETEDKKRHVEPTQLGSVESRRDAFVDARSKATAGPTWATQVLRAPEGAEAAVEDAPALVRGSGAEDGVDTVVPTEVDEEALEREALEKQQKLGAVSDMDFLSMLGGQPAPAEEAEARHTHGESDEEAGPSTHVHNEEEESDEEDRLPETNAAPATSATQAPPEDEEVDEETKARISHRIRLGNLPYIATEENIKQFASSLVGPVEAVHIPLTRDTRQSKGAAFVKFVRDEDAVRALTLCRGAIMMGRLLRVSAAEEDPHSRRVLEREAAQAATGGVGASAVAGSSEFKKNREKERRQEAEGGGMTWNTMFMNSHAAVETVAKRLGVTSQDVVSVGTKGAAVRAAIAEAYLSNEVQQVLSDEGIAFDLVESATQNFLKVRSNTTILVKNLSLKNAEEAAELSKMFVRFGLLETSAFPSSGMFALFRYAHAQDARVAFTRLAYKLFKASPLFLEWAPVGAIVDDAPENGEGAAAVPAIPSSKPADDSSDDEGEGKTHKDGASEGADAETKATSAAPIVYTLFIANIAFNTSEEAFHTFLLDACPRLARAPDQLITRLVLQSDQGRAFLTLPDPATFTYCMTKLHGKSLGGRTLSCVASKQTSTATTEAKQGKAPNEDEDEDPTKMAVIARHRGQASSTNSKVPPGADPLKLIVKNLPFEATEKDVRELFSAFSEVRSVRVPRKTHTFSSHRENNHRGFAFVEFMSETEAARALETLKATHLYGRHLVLQYAKLDS